MPSAVIPPRLRPGDTVGVITPSAPAPGVFPQRFERGLSQLRSMGFSVKLSERARSVAGSVSADARARADDLVEMFLDPSVAAIVASIGGGHSHQMLPYINWDVIAANPKVFVGYSDVTVLHHAIGEKTGLVTYYGPTVMTEFSEFPEMLSESRDGFLRATCEDAPLLIAPFARALVDVVDWGSPDESTTPRRIGEATPPRTIRPGLARGSVTGGCIESFERLRGTPYWPEVHGTILCLESASGEPNVSYLEVVFADLENMGVWDAIVGVLFGRKQWPAPVLDAIGDLLARYTERSRIPAAIGLDFGHISPIATIPLRQVATFDAAVPSLAFA